MTSRETCEDLLSRIRQQSYWRFLLEPHHEGRAFATRTAAKDALKTASVRLRRWDFPHFNDHETHGGNRPISGGWESWTEFHDLEACRIYQSGQFIQYKTLAEDSERSGWGQRDAPGPFLDFVSTIYHITEFFEFVRRLAALGAYEGSLTTSVSLHRMAGRHLTAEMQRGLFRNYVCLEDDIRSERIIAVDTLSISSSDNALRAISEIFEWFDFATDEQVLADGQRQLLDRRPG